MNDLGASRGRSLCGGGPDGARYSPLDRVSRDPETGTQRWVYDAGIDRDAGYGDFANRGVSTWHGGTIVAFALH